MDNYEAVLRDLQADFGKQKTLSPAEIAPYIKRSPDAQTALRKRNNFPIPFKKMGGEIVISIYDLARYLSTSNADFDEKKPCEACPNLKIPTKAPSKKIGHRGISLGKTLFEFGTQIEKVERQLDFMKALSRELERLELEDQVRKDLTKKTKQGF